MWGGAGGPRLGVGSGMVVMEHLYYLFLWVLVFDGLLSFRHKFVGIARVFVAFPFSLGKSVMCFLLTGSPFSSWGLILLNTPTSCALVSRVFVMN